MKRSWIDPFQIIALHAIVIAGLGLGSVAAGQTAAPILASAAADTTNSSPATSTSAADCREQPEIAPGIHLPATGAAWILDDQDGKQELVRVRHSLGTWNRHTGKNTARSFGWPFVGQVTSLDLAHPNADVQVHANAPIFFLRQTVRDQEELDDPSRGKGQYSIVHLKTDGQIRVVSRFIFDSLSKPQRAPDLIDTKVEVLANASGWMKIEPAKPLIPGHYAVIYMLSNSEQIDDNIYDFDVKP